MEQWTIAEPSDGRYRRHINFGGKPYWCMFDFAVLPAPECCGVEFVLASDPDPVSAEWFPHWKSGMLRGLETAREHGREWTGTRIEIHEVHTHSIDMTVLACERYGFSFVLDELPRGGMQITNSS